MVKGHEMWLFETSGPGSPEPPVDLESRWAALDCRLDARDPDFTAARAYVVHINNDTELEAIEWIEGKNLRNPRAFVMSIYNKREVA